MSRCKAAIIQCQVAMGRRRVALRIQSIPAYLLTPSMSPPKCGAKWLRPKRCCLTFSCSYSHLRVQTCARMSLPCKALLSLFSTPQHSAISAATKHLLPQASYAHLSYVVLVVNTCQLCLWPISRYEPLPAKHTSASYAKQLLVSTSGTCCQDKVQMHTSIPKKDKV